MNFLDAQEMHIRCPKTFEVPSDKELINLKVGDVVKISNGKERFWTIIKIIDGDKIIAVVDNDLLGDYGYNYGDEIAFEKRHIYAIWEK